MDLGIALINHGLSLDWKDLGTDKAKRPSYVRQKKDWVPCGCRDKGVCGQIRCFFCANGMTHEIAHRDMSKKKPTSSKARKVCSDRVDIGKGVAYCHYCVEEAKAETVGATVVQARKLAAAKAKADNTSASTRLPGMQNLQHACLCKALG